MNRFIKLTATVACINFTNCSLPKSDCSTMDPMCGLLPDLLYLIPAPGSLDRSFGSGLGYITAGGASGANGDSGNTLTLDSSGRVLVAGSSVAGSSDAVMWRILSDGSGLDTTFNGVGYKVLASTGNYEASTSIGVSASGRILVYSTFFSGANFDVAIQGYTTSGPIDTTFGTAGTSTWNGGNNDLSTNMIVNSDAIYLAGQMDNGGANMDYSVFKLTLAGAFDTTYGSGTGRFQQNNLAGSTNDRGGPMAQAPTGEIYQTGFADNGAANADIGIMKVKTNGTIDTTFNSVGYRVFTSLLGGPGVAEAGTCVAVDSQGRVLMGGSYNNNGNYFLMRLLSTGALDTTFGSAGIVLLQGSPVSIPLDSYGRILVGSNVSNRSTGVDISITRYLDSGNVDITFANGGAFFLANPGTDAIGQMIFDSSGRIVLTGSVSSGNATKMIVMRVWN